MDLIMQMKQYYGIMPPCRDPIDRVRFIAPPRLRRCWSRRAQARRHGTGMTGIIASCSWSLP